MMTPAESVVAPDRLSAPLRTRDAPALAKIQTEPPRGGSSPTPTAHRFTVLSRGPRGSRAASPRWRRPRAGGAKPERLGRSERGEVHLRPHQDEEDRRQQFPEGTKGVLGVVDVPLPELLEVNGFEDETRRERAHDRRQPRHPGQMGRGGGRRRRATTRSEPPPPAGAPRPETAGGGPRADEERAGKEADRASG